MSRASVNSNEMLQMALYKLEQPLSGWTKKTRNFLRHGVRKIVSYERGDKRFLTLTLDLGLNGMRIETSHLLPKNEYLRMQLVLGRNSIQVKGRTVYSRLLSNRQIVTGIHFVEIAQKDLRELQDCLAHTQ